MNKTQIKHMVNRFLQWRLPADFSPDGGISFKSTFNKGGPYEMKNEPVGTNLLDAQQTEAMIKFVTKDLPVPKVLILFKEMNEDDDSSVNLVGVYSETAAPNIIAMAEAHNLITNNKIDAYDKYQLSMYNIQKASDVLIDHKSVLDKIKTELGEPPEHPENSPDGCFLYKWEIVETKENFTGV